MDKKEYKFLKEILRTPSPSGYEDPVRKLWFDEMKTYSDKITIDNTGNVIASLNVGKKSKIMLAGHMDELGFQVSYVCDKGYIYFGTLGGFDVNIIAGRKVRIHTSKGDITGVVGKKAIHLLDADERKKATKLHQLYIDIGAKDKKETLKLIEIGDPITYDPTLEKLRNRLYVSRAFDDKIGAFIVAEVLKKVSEKKNKLKAELHSVATVQEEVGLRGARTAAYAIDPDVGIAIDVTHATDTPDCDPKKDGDVKLGEGVAITRGPNINPKIFELLIKIAKKKKIKYQVEAASRPTGTDANVIQISRAGVATGLISIPCRYMHTQTEVISMKDVDSAIDLLTAFCFEVK
jgi:tetrahedral aminopeptidase